MGSGIETTYAYAANLKIFHAIKFDFTRHQSNSIIFYQ